MCCGWNCGVFLGYQVANSNVQRAQEQVAQQLALALGCSVVGIKSRIAPSILKVECKSAWRPVLPTVKKKNTKY